MIKDILRVIALTTFILVIFVDIPVPIILNTPLNQLIIGLFIIFIIVIVDEIFGFLLGLIILVVYYKYYQKVFNTNNGIESGLKEPLLAVNHLDTFKVDIKPPPNNKIGNIGDHYVKFNNDSNCIEMPYISNELLEKAQNNIYDITNYNMEIITDSDKTYGIQGLNSASIHFPAYDKNTIEHNYK